MIEDDLESRAKRIIIEALKTVDGNGRERLMRAATEFFELGATAAEWDRAKKHLDDTISAYADLLSAPGVNPCFALGSFSELEKRYQSGERTEPLFQAMMSVE